MRRERRRGRRIFGLIALCLLLLIALPIVGVETVCRAPAATGRAVPTGHFGIADPGYARPTVNSVLSYPDWSILYAYQDFAATLQQGDEHSFRYLAGIADYWRGLCAVNRAAPGGTIRETVTLSVVGVSFSAEMGLEGAYETTIGWLTAAIRGRTKTVEDELALWVTQDYADFVGQWPWYQYSFWKQVRRLWSLPLADRTSTLRSVERHMALGLDWGAKSISAQVIGAAAGLSDTPREIESVVGGLDRAQISAIPDLVIVRSVSDDKWLVRTPRYDAFTRTLLALAAAGGQIYEIGGNERIFVTVRVADGTAGDALPGGRQLFSAPIRSRPGWRRVGEDSTVATLADAIRDAQGRGIEIEHIYDF